MFLFAVDISIHTLVCNRPVKVTKKCVWPCCEILFISSLSLPGLGHEVGQAVPVQFLTGHIFNHLSTHPPATHWILLPFANSLFLSHSLFRSSSQSASFILALLNIFFYSPASETTYLSLDLCFSSSSHTHLHPFSPPDFPPPPIFQPKA